MLESSPWRCYILGATLQHMDLGFVWLHREICSKCEWKQKQSQGRITLFQGTSQTHGYVHAATACGCMNIAMSSCKPKSLHVKVQSQNRLVSRICHLLHLCWTRGVFWVLEQPKSSVLFQHRRFKKTMKLHGATAIDMDMGAYGGPSVKESVLVGTAPYMQDRSI